MHRSELQEKERETKRTVELRNASSSSERILELDGHDAFLLFLLKQKCD